MMFVGIDISKLRFDVAVLMDGRYQHQHFNTTPSGFSQLSKWVSAFKHPAYFCLEATGIYGLALAKHLAEKSNRSLLPIRYKRMRLLKWKCLVIKQIKPMR